MTEGIGREFSADEFFASQKPPAHLEEHLEAVKAFAERNVAQGRRVVLVTSGGTTVPLEHNVVRFLDNFSAGTRGAASAEHFLRTGQYAVIFLHRQHSLQPFSRHYSHSTNPFLDLLDVVPEDPKGKGRDTSNHSLFPPIPAVGTTASRPVSRSPSAIENGLPAGYDSRQQQIVVRAPHREPMLALLKAYKLVKSMRILLSIPYVSVDEYLFYLRGISRVLEGVRDPQGRSAGQRTMYYLAAAVSDFFIPRQRMSEHKIQSGKGSLIIEMDQVPKVLKTMVQEWSKQGFIVSFKLETDPQLIIPKARVALERYGHSVVIGNSLATRKHEVVFVQKDREEWLRLNEHELETPGIDGAIKEIEEDIVGKLVHMHDQWIVDHP